MAMSNISGGGPVTPPGWYKDAQGSTRWWDGSHWTEHVQAINAASGNPAASQPLRPWYKQPLRGWHARLGTVSVTLSIFAIAGFALAVWSATTSTRGLDPLGLQLVLAAGAGGTCCGYVGCRIPRRTQKLLAVAGMALGALACLAMGSLTLYAMLGA